MDRVLANVRSGRDFPQTFQLFWRQELQVGRCFETLASARRLGSLAVAQARVIDGTPPINQGVTGDRVGENAGRDAGWNRGIIRA